MPEGKWLRCSDVLRDGLGRQETQTWVSVGDRLCAELWEAAGALYMVGEGSSGEGGVCMHNIRNSGFD